jgi:ADP-ribose pyrophosphatase YjhB (NUDIX family)
MTRTLDHLWKRVLGRVSARLARYGKLPYWRYRLLLGQVPIACVDLMPVRQRNGRTQIGLIKRRDERGGVRWAMLGGGVWRGETIAAALDRHVKETLGEEATIELPDGQEHPPAVGQYFPQLRPGFGHDPRKHSIAVSYWAALSGETTAMGEAEDFDWFDLAAIPPDSEFGYGHELIVARLVENLTTRDGWGAVQSRR